MELLFIKEFELYAFIWENGYKMLAIFFIKPVHLQSAVYICSAFISFISSILQYILIFVVSNMT